MTEGVRRLTEEEGNLSHYPVITLIDTDTPYDQAD